VSNKFYPKILPLENNLEKNIVDPSVMGFACRMTKARIQTHTQNQSLLLAD